MIRLPFYNIAGLHDKGLVGCCEPMSDIKTVGQIGLMRISCIYRHLSRLTACFVHPVQQVMIAERIDINNAAMKFYYCMNDKDASSLPIGF
jgi:hypothetical protein